MIIEIAATDTVELLSDIFIRGETPRNILKRSKTIAKEALSPETSSTLDILETTSAAGPFKV